MSSLSGNRVYELRIALALIDKIETIGNPEAVNLIRAFKAEWGKNDADQEPSIKLANFEHSDVG